MALRIHLGPQARQLLELLLHSEGGVVSKAEIAAKLWPNRPPSDNSIDRCAYLLRKPLREAGGGDLIATAYGRGLSLRAEVRIIDAHHTDPRPRDGELDGHILDLWQAAYELAGRRTRDACARAQSAVAAAAELEPDKPAIWSLAADIAAYRAVRGHLRPHAAAALIERDARRALELAPDFTAALAVLGWARAALLCKVEDGTAMLDQAVSQDPHSCKARSYRSWVHLAQGRATSAADDLDAGLRVSPHDQSLLTMRVWREICSGNIDASAHLAAEALGLRPDGSWLHGLASIAQSLGGRHEEAETAARLGLDVAPDDPLLIAALAYVLARGGKSAEAESMVAAARIDDQTAAPGLFVAAALLALERREEAVTALARAREEGCPWFQFAPLDPRLAPLREHIDRLRATPLKSSPKVEFAPPET